MNSNDFLRLILPVDGLKAAFFLPTKRHTFTNDTDALAETIHRLDLEGFTAYHACGVFAQGSTKRWVANTVGAKSFWLDIDAGEGKPYATAKDAALAVGSFSVAVGIPTPLMVSSGAGIHAYWPLEELIPKAEWQLYATGLKALCEEHRLLADRTRTADIASILRTPGTHNYKRGGAEVRVVYQAGPFKLQQFSVFAGKGQAPRERLPKADPLTASLLHVQDYPKVYADDVAEGCAQVAVLRDSEGAVSEPIWHALSGVLAFTEDGEERALEWASGGYEGEIAKKFERARALSGPVSCDAVQSVAGTDLCKGCPLFGQGRNPTMVSRPQKAAESAQPAPPVSVDTPVGIGDCPVPEPFRIEDNSLIMAAPTPAGPVDVIVCNHAVLLKSTARGEATDEKYSYVFARYDPQIAGYREFTLSAKTIMGSGGLAEIAGRGGSIQMPDKYMQYLRAAVPMVQSEDYEMIKYEQFGWKENDTTFLYGNRLYTPEGLEPAVGTTEVEARSALMRPRTGSLEAWSRAAGRLFAAGAEAQSICLLAAFAAPLMRFQSADEGGAVISLIGSSGVGKSTALAAASSVWGRDKGVTIKNEDTYNAKFISLGVLCNLPVIYDEVHMTDPEIVKRLIIAFTNGTDRARGTTDGGLVHKSNGWQTLLITGSNPSLVETIGNLPGSDAAAMRIFEMVVRMPPGTDHKSGDELKRQFELNAGWAGDAYLKYLMTPGVLPYVKQALHKYTKEIWEKSGLKSEYRFWVRSIAAIAVAGVVVSKMGLIDFSPQRIIQWAMKDMPEQASGIETNQRDPGSVIAAFLNEHLADTLVVHREYRHDNTGNFTIKVPTRQLFVRYQKQDATIYIDERQLRRWTMIHGGGNYRELLDKLRDAGIAKYGNWRRSLGAGTDMPSGQIPVVKIDASRAEFSGFTAEVEQGNVVSLESRR